jgi:hypothetical protein
VALSRLAQEFAAEIKQHGWSDAPYRADRAGHDRARDSKRSAEELAPEETEKVLLNVMWVTAQVLGHADANFDVVEFAGACGVDTTKWSRLTLENGLRKSLDGRYDKPGTRGASGGTDRG